MSLHFQDITVDEQCPVQRPPSSLRNGTPVGVYPSEGPNPSPVHNGDDVLGPKVHGEPHSHFEVRQLSFVSGKTHFVTAILFVRVPDLPFVCPVWCSNGTNPFRLQVVHIPQAVAVSYTHLTLPTICSV